MTAPHSPRTFRRRLLVTRLLAALPLLATLGVMALSSALFAADGRDFLGSYTVDSATDLGSTFRIAMTLRLTNYSASDATNATVILQDSLSPGTDTGTLVDSVSIPSKGSVRLSAELTISREEFLSWSNGGAPSLRIEYSDGSPDRVRRTIEVTEAQAGVE